MLVWLTLDDVIRFSHLLTACSSPSWDANCFSASPQITRTLCNPYCLLPNSQVFNSCSTLNKLNPVHDPIPNSEVLY